MSAKNAEMEKLNYCLNMIECCDKDLKVIQNEINSIDQSLRKICSASNAVEKLDVIQRLEESEKVLYNDRENSVLKLEILKNNAAIALYDYVLPYVIQVIGKFAGKRVGEKTEQKIKDMFQELTGFRMYITNDWGGYRIAVYMLTDQGYSDDRVKTIMIDFNNGKLFDDDGKLLPVENLNARLLDTKNQYVDDPDTEVKVLKELHNKILEAAEILEKACKDYNEHTVGNIPNKYGKSFFNDLMRG